MSDEITQGKGIPYFGRSTGRHAMRDRDANLLIDALNAFLNLEVVFTSEGKSELLVVKGKSILKLRVEEIAADPPTTTGVIQKARIDSLAGDYLVCNLWDYVEEDWSAETVNVAKPPSLRNSVTSEGGFSYSYSDTNTRTATAAGYDAIVYSVDRPYAVGTVLMVADTGGDTGVTDATYVDLNWDARAWIAIPVVPIP